MARVSIYVPDEMKSRMDEIGDEVNWSGAAQAAFDIEIKRNKLKGDKTMEAAIERLRLSKAEYRQGETVEAEEDGRTWALETAEYSDLLAIKRMVDEYGEDLQGCREPADEALHSALEIENDESPFWNWDLGKYVKPTPEYVTAWMRGALTVFDRI